ncbi:hypothetical protein LINPERHAP2_LOCUS12128, partial [Linum perenne]
MRRHASLLMRRHASLLMRMLPSFPLDEEVDMMTSSSWSR